MAAPSVDSLASFPLSYIYAGGLTLPRAPGRPPPVKPEQRSVAFQLALAAAVVA
jgi:hypothetical protein